MPGVTGFTPEGVLGIYGHREWTYEATTNATAAAVSDKTQSAKIRVENTLWVYFADAYRDDPKVPPAYYVLHHMVLSAAPAVSGGPLANKNDARGYFNSSALVHYYAPPIITPGCTIRKEFQTPRDGDDQFDTIVDGPEIPIIGKTPAGGTGKVLFKPSYQARNRADKWSLRGSAEPSWELYQREVWNAAGVDGPVDGKFDVKVPDEWVEDFFDGAFGRIKEMPKSSFAPLSCEMFVAWRIDGPANQPFTVKDRVVTMILPLESMQRLTLFHNGNLGSEHEPRRLCALAGGAENKTFQLHEIAVPHGI